MLSASHKGLNSLPVSKDHLIFFSHKTKYPCLLRVTGYCRVFGGCLGGIPPWLSIYKVLMTVVSQCFCHLLSERSYLKLQLQSGI